MIRIRILIGDLALAFMGGFGLVFIFLAWSGS